MKIIFMELYLTNRIGNVFMVLVKYYVLAR